MDKSFVFLKSFSPSAIPDNRSPMNCDIRKPGLNRGIPPGISDPFSIFPGCDLLCLGHWLRTWRPCAVLHAQ